MTHSDDGTPAIELRGVTKRYGDEVAVSGLDLTVPRGATYGLLGPNGSGKTSTIRMMLRIIEANGGSIRLFGRPPDREALDRVGYLPEERGVYKKMRVRRFLTFLGELKGLSARDSSPRIAAWLERLDLADRAGARLQELSKGMQQKIQFVAAILHEPELVILDEPFSGLDPINQQVLKDIIGDLRKQGKTILFSTHIIANAERTCDHVCIMARGKKVLDGELGAVKAEHAGAFVGLTLERWGEETSELLRRLPGVGGVREHGSEAELSLADGADPQAILEDLVRNGVRLLRFERVQPSLEQIFVERVGEEPRDQVGAIQEVVHV